MKFIQLNCDYVDSTVISTAEEEKVKVIYQQISPHAFVETKTSKVSVISKEERLINPTFQHIFWFSVLFFFLLTGIDFSANSQQVKRIISLAPSITENLYLIGAQDKLVGCTSYCTLAVKDGVQQVGSTIDFNIEKILMLKPDLVITMQLTKPQDVEAMRKLGINVKVFYTPKDFNEICLQNLEIARLTGNVAASEKAIAKAKYQVDSLKNVMKSYSKKKVFFQLGANPIFAVLQHTFLNDYIIFCNAENIVDGMKTGIISRESVMSKNPDVIFVATMGGYGAEEKKVWESYKGLKAAETGSIFLIESETSCSPTPDNFAKAFADVVKCMKK
jgi:iron complex transport system substrate-binding protein